MAELAVGAVFGGVRIDAVASRGGMGIVYRGTELTLNRPVALRLLSSDLAENTELRDRFRRESEIAACLDHPHLLPIHAVGEQDGLHYVTTHHVDGTELRELIQRNGRLAPALAAALVNQVAGALDLAHSHGLVHRDVTPANILIAESATGPHAYLTNFGLSHTVTGGAGPTRTGTMDYVAPEQLEGVQSDGRADIYALGCVLYQALVGQVPFPLETEPAKMFAHLSQPPPLLAQTAPELPAELDPVVQQAMAKRPEERFATAGAFGRAAVAASAVDRRSEQISPLKMNTFVQGQSTTLPGGYSDNRPTSPPDGYSGSHPVSPSGGYQAGSPTVSVFDGRPRPNPSFSNGYPGGYQTGNAGLGGPLPPSPGGTAAGGRPGWRGKLLWILTSVAMVVALVIGVVLLLLGDRTPLAGTVLGQPIQVGDEPMDIESGEGFLWTANRSDGTISKIDPQSARSEQIPVDGDPFELVVAEGAVWVWNYSDAITRVDTATGAVSAPIQTEGLTINGIAAGDGYLWLSHSADNAVSRINLRTQAFEGTPVTVGTTPVAMAYGDRSLYVVNTGDSTLSALDGTSGQVRGTPLPLDDELGGIDVDNGTIYVGSTDDVTSIDERFFVVDDPIPLKGGSLFAPDGTSMWVAFPLENTVRRFDIVSREERGEPIEGVGKGAGDLLVVDNVLWVVDSSGDAVIRIKINS